MQNPLAPVADWFLLRRAEAHAAQVPDERREQVRKLCAAGVLRLNAANDLREGTPEIGLILLSDASLFLIAALADQKGRHFELDAGVSAAWELLDGMKSELERAPADLSEIRATLSEKTPMAFDSLPREEAISKFSSAEAALSWLRRQIETRSPKQIRRARIVRIVLSAAALLLLAVWGIASLFSAPNIALNKPTTASGYWAGSPRDGLTNGVNESAYAVATNLQVEPWILLDLQNTYRISSIVVVPRGDGHADELVPIAVEISENGVAYSEAARRTDTFSQSSPWTISLSGKPARYVRVRVLKQTVLALAEIEVRGRR